MSNIIDGRKIAKLMCDELALKLAVLKRVHHTVPGLAVIIVGEDLASKIYVDNKIAKCKELGINFFKYEIPEKIKESILLRKIEMLNHDPKVHGILVQLPVPGRIDMGKVINAISPEKDVDGFHPDNLGKLISGQEGFVPCTPQGCMVLIKSVIKNLDGLKALVIGRSRIVGKPLSCMLINENCTTTIAHSYTKNLKEECLKADIVISAVGQANLIKGSWIKEGAVVIDVGINRLPGGQRTLTGDVEFEGAKKRAQAITPVPGGVGPMTIACLMNNTLLAACMHKHIKIKDLNIRF
jgi:methylenetetrahydrofolate dehydrogenase (NADP+) / methenyltetrahydrofolate cyclohydrolase